MATKTGIELQKTPQGWEAPCSCRFHIFDGAPKLEQSSVIFTGETILIGKLAPHWHICERHAAIKIEMDRGE